MSKESFSQYVRLLSELIQSLNETFFLFQLLVQTSRSISVDSVFERSWRHEIKQKLFNSPMLRRSYWLGSTTARSKEISEEWTDADDDDLDNVSLFVHDHLKPPPDDSYCVVTHR